VGDTYRTKANDLTHREFRYGALERSMTLAQGVNAEEIKANFSNGLLQLTILIPEEGVPKEMKVQAPSQCPRRPPPYSSGS
jgi:HSP20 family molecular chaperone IbpA